MLNGLNTRHGDGLLFAWAAAVFSVVVFAYYEKRKSRLIRLIRCRNSVYTLGFGFHMRG